jgi:hypothetical protein
VQFDTSIIQGNLVNNCGRGIFVEDSTHLLFMGNSLRGLTEAQAVLLRTSDASKSISTHFASNQVTGNAGAAVVEQGSGAFDTHYLYNDLRSNAGGAFQNVQHCSATSPSHRTLGLPWGWIIR